MPVLNRIADFAEEMKGWRQHLHQNPELEFECHQTAAFIIERLHEIGVDEIHAGIAKTGIVAIINGQGAGRTIGLRADMDALPIEEATGAPYASRVKGKMHACGHDGHVTMLLGAAKYLAETRRFAGRVALLFQPAEEDGSGAAAVLADPRFADLAPDWAFALHNLPGLPLGVAVLEPGAANCASVGMRLRLSGRTAHAAEPHLAISPAAAIAALVPGLQALGNEGAAALGPGFRLVTLTHLRMGVPAFGITPGEGEVFATLRCLEDGDMAALKAQAVALAEGLAAQHGLGLEVTWHDDFAASRNDPEATAHLRAALAAAGVARIAGAPMRASEDFGRFGAVARSAMFWFGAGTAHPALHAPDYDFPDALIAPGMQVFLRVLDDLLG